MTKESPETNNAIAQPPADMRVRVGPLMYQLMKEHGDSDRKLNYVDLEAGIEKLIADKDRAEATAQQVRDAPKDEAVEFDATKLAAHLIEQMDSMVGSATDEILSHQKEHQDFLFQQLGKIEGAVNSLRFMYAVLAADETEDVRFCIEKANKELDQIMTKMKDPSLYIQREQEQDLDDDTKASTRAMRSMEGGDGREYDPQDVKEQGERER